MSTSVQKLTYGFIFIANEKGMNGFVDVACRLRRAHSLWEREVGPASVCCRHIACNAGPEVDRDGLDATCLH